MFYVKYSIQNAEMQKKIIMTSSHRYSIGSYLVGLSSQYTIYSYITTPQVINLNAYQCPAVVCL